MVAVAQHPGGSADTSRGQISRERGRGVLGTRRCGRPISAGASARRLLKVNVRAGPALAPGFLTKGIQETPLPHGAPTQRQRPLNPPTRGPGCPMHPEPLVPPPAPGTATVPPWEGRCPRGAPRSPASAPQPRPNALRTSRESSGSHVVTADPGRVPEKQVLDLW